MLRNRRTITSLRTEVIPLAEPNWTELLEQNYGQDSGAQKLIKLWRSEGQSDKEIYQTLESFW